MKDLFDPFEATSDLPSISYGAMRELIMIRVKSSRLKVLQDEERHLTVETAHGLIGLRPGRNTEAAGYVGAVDEHWLFVLKNEVTQLMQRVMPEVAAEMRWSNGPKAGSLPPNFDFVTVREVTELGPNFLRVTLQGEDLSRHQDGSIHFRLVQPPAGGAPHWPTVAANGAVAWPEGDGAPHRPVYTARRIDHRTNTLIMDVYLHDGGRTSEWARGHLGTVGQRRVVGVLGPIGGGLLDADRVLMASDETGFPAAARLLESLPDTVTGELFLEAENGADCAYPISVPSGLKLTWLARASGDDLGRATLQALPHHTGSKIWFAGERAQAKTLREALKAAGRDAGDLRISGFWAKPAEGH